MEGERTGVLGETARNCGHFRGKVETLCNGNSSESLRVIPGNREPKLLTSCNQARRPVEGH